MKQLHKGHATFDAIHLKNDDLQLVQVTLADHHSIKSQGFTELLQTNADITTWLKRPKRKANVIFITPGTIYYPQPHDECTTTIQPKSAKTYMDKWGVIQCHLQMPLDDG